MSRTGKFYAENGETYEGGPTGPDTRAEEPPKYRRTKTKRRQKFPHIVLSSRVNCGARKCGRDGCHTYPKLRKQARVCMSRDPLSAKENDCSTG